MAISFFVPGKPVPKARARAYSRNGQTRMYTPKTTADYETLVQSICRESFSKPLECPLCVYLAIALPVPLSWSKKRKEAALKQLIRPTSRPDIDNYVKAIFDGMNGVAFVDDAQVVRLECEKFYGETPGVVVTVNLYKTSCATETSGVEFESGKRQGLISLTPAFPR